MVVVLSGRCLALVVAIASACVTSSAHRCDDGRVCPSNLVCAETSDPPAKLCVRANQIADCNGMAPFSPCGNDGLGRCYEGICIPGGCGNGRTDRDGDLDPDLTNEECDDGNTEPGDGCSPICLIERCGNGALDMSLGEQCDDGVTGVSGDGCSSTCGVETPSWTDISPTPIPAMHGTQLAYMASEGAVIAFGGLGEAGHHDGTWSWTPQLQRWTRLAPRRSPPARRSAAMAYDSTAQYILVFGGDGQLGDLSDTWKWDGTIWTELHPTTIPPARRGTQLAFDPARNRFVLAGGVAGSASLRDTWEFDGTNWILRAAAGAPEFTNFAMTYHAATQQMVAGGAKARGAPFETWTWSGTAWTELSPSNEPTVEDGFRLAYDAGRQRTVLFGGVDPLSNAVWEWDGASWQGPLTPGTPPPARALHGTAYDGTQVVIFGGAATSNGPFFSDTWTWNGSWSQASLGVVEPSGRSHLAMAWDPLDGVAIMHGGFDGTTLGDSWIWNGHAWSPFGSSSQPRRYAAMSFDSARRKMVLFGGSDASGAAMTNLWELDPSNPTEWTAVSAIGPNARYDHAMAFDAARGTTVLFGGTNGLARSGDTWTWNGTTWTQHTVPGPSARTAARMTWDARRERVVLFGGRASGVVSDTWEWDGAAWTQLTTPTVPRGRERHGFAYDPVRGRVVMHGGIGTFTLGDLWELDGVDWMSIPLADTELLMEHVMVFGRGMITFGGTSYGMMRANVRRLQFGNDDGVDRCIDGDDADGDMLTGCADPDCWGHCTPLCPPSGPACPATAPRCGDGACAPVEDHLVCAADCPP